MLAASQCCLRSGDTRLCSEDLSCIGAVLQAGPFTLGVFVLRLCKSDLPVELHLIIFGRRTEIPVHISEDRIIMRLCSGQIRLCDSPAGVVRGQAGKMIKSRPGAL